MQNSGKDNSPPQFRLFLSDVFPYPSQQCPAVTTALFVTSEPVHMKDPPQPRVIITKCGNSPGNNLAKFGNAITPENITDPLTDR